MKKLEILSIVIGIFMSVFGLVFGSYDPLWDQFDVNADVRGGLTIGLSLFFLLLGFLFAIYLKSQSQEEILNQTLNDLKYQIPQLSTFKVMDANSALSYLECQLPLIRSMINTRIASNQNAGYSTTEGKSYNAAIEKSIKKGLQLREIVNKPWQESAENRKQSLTSIILGQVNGSYEFQVVDTALPSFLNFSVLAYLDGRKEVIFGWAITKGRRFEQKCFVSDERSIVEFFESWFYDLYSAQ